MARAMWKASLRIGERTVPVKMYAAVENRALHFRMLHASDGVPVEQRMVDPRTGQEVEAGRILRGVEVEPGRFVLVRPEELGSVEPSRFIDVLRFVPRAAIDVAWYDHPYFLGPDEGEARIGTMSAGAAEDYAALAAALKETDRCGVARWTLRGKRYVGVLNASGPHLALISLHAPQYVIPTSELPRPTGSEITQPERKLAEQLVAALDEPFDPGLLRDEHRARVEALIAAKAEGKPVELAAETLPAPNAPLDLRDLLQRSLQTAKERRNAAA